jgi:xanthine dehydrogenase YagT iron-sulfur-binding subunit
MFLRIPDEVALNTGSPDMAICIELDVNQRRHALRVAGCSSLLEVLREQLGLTGTKRGCDAGACGACTVLLDGRRVNACLVLAAAAEGHAVTTIEGLSSEGVLHPLQQAFIDHDALQCGFCTPGQILSGIGLLAEGRPLDSKSVKEWMSGNLCRCGAHPNIVDAIIETGR